MVSDIQEAWAIHQAISVGILPITSWSCAPDGCRRSKALIDESIHTTLVRTRAIYIPSFRNRGTNEGLGFLRGYSIMGCVGRIEPGLVIHDHR